MFLSLKVHICGMHVGKLIDVGHLRYLRHAAERLVVLQA